MIERTFQNIPEGKLSEADQQSFLVSLGWSRGMTWEDLLSSKRVLMVSEAGAGKTYECRERAQRLWDAGEPTFFVELARLAEEDLRNLLDHDEEARLDAWLSSQSDIATFFPRLNRRTETEPRFVPAGSQALEKGDWQQAPTVPDRHNDAADPIRRTACAPSAAHSSGTFDGAE